MVVISFLLILCGLCVVTVGVLLSTLHAAGAGKWPGFHPRRWDGRFKKTALLTGGGFILTLAGFLAGYGI